MNNCTCVKTPYIDYIEEPNTPNPIVNTNNLILDSNKITTNKEGLIYFILKENYYKRLFKAVELAGKYNKNNKRYYYSFYDFETKQKYRLNSREIWLAKNNIITLEQLKSNIEYQLYQDKLVNNIVDHNKYQYIMANRGYNFMSLDGFKKYLRRNIYYFYNENCQLGNCKGDLGRITKQSEYIEDDIYIPRDSDPIVMFEKKKGIYEKFFKEYQNALYSSNIYNKINHIKNTSLKAKKGNMGVRFNTKIFPNIKGK